MKETIEAINKLKNKEKGLRRELKIIEKQLKEIEQAKKEIILMLAGGK